MHKTLNILTNTVETAAKGYLNEEQLQVFNAAREFISFFQNKLARGLALTKEDEAFLSALLIFVLGMVKDSSITEP
jgi:hypothetical protein